MPHPPPPVLTTTTPPRRIVEPTATDNVDDLLPKLASSCLLYLWTPYGYSGKAARVAGGAEERAQQAFNVCAYAVGNLTAKEIRRYDLQVMSALLDICKLHTLAITSDGAQVNRQVAKDACETDAERDARQVEGAYTFVRCCCRHPLTAGQTLCYIMVRCLLILSAAPPLSHGPAHRSFPALGRVSRPRLPPRRTRRMARRRPRQQLVTRT
jgi:hypothetical protein